MRRILLLLPALLLLACPAEEPETPEPVTEEPTATPTAAPLVCDPPLSLPVAEYQALPLGLLTIVPEGGTGAYRFELIDNQSGALLNELSGSYLAGRLTGAVDTVRVTDTGCEGEVIATIRVVDAMTVEPRRAVVAPGTSFTFDVRGGSGLFSCSYLRNSSTGTLSTGCDYTAGVVEDTDLILVTDDATGFEVDVTVQVVDGTVLEPVPPQIILPVGASFQVGTRGGSGAFDLSAPAGTVNTDEAGFVHGLAAGRQDVEIIDRFTGQTAWVRVDVTESLSSLHHRDGEYIMEGRAMSAGDVNGDGFTDALIGFPEASVSAWRGGAVLLYPGVPGGLSDQPVRIFSGTTWDERMGNSLMTGDFDDDGLMDLAVGAPYADENGTDSGAVLIYSGVPGRFYSEEPTSVLVGEEAWVRLGKDIAFCDVNADGFGDLIVGAYIDEDTTLADVPWSQGSVNVFFGSPTGFAPNPDRTVFGVIPDGAGAWTGSTNMNIGRTVAAGDINNDGACDVVASAWTYDPPFGGYNDAGAVLVFAGVAANGQTMGGITSEPVLAITPRVTGDSSVDDLNARLGYNMDVGDLDGDGYADLALSAWYGTWDRPSWGNPVRHGGLRVFSGADLVLDGSAVWTEAETSDWAFWGDTTWDYAGFHVRIADTDFDGRNDLVVGSVRDSRGGVGGDRAGELQIFYGIDGALPALTPDLYYGGINPEDFFGQNFGVLPDIDGDGLADYVVHSGREDSLGFDVGMPYFVSSTDGSLNPLAYPSEPSGSQFGYSAQIVGDVTGDGFEDLLVGAPTGEGPDGNHDHGDLWLYLGTSSGFETDPAMSFRGLIHNFGGDWFGYDIAPLGDFDGDGVDDFAVVARYDEIEWTGLGYHWRYNPDSRYVNPDECSTSVGNGGSVQVFLGNPAGLPVNEPAFIYFAQQAGDITEVVTGGGDVNGDGYDDLLLGSWLWERGGTTDAGGAILLTGRPPDPAGITVICTEDWSYLGTEQWGNAGESLAILGDLDGDGCSEFALGTRREDFGIYDQGSVRVFFGWGTTCNYATPNYITYISSSSPARAGAALAGGHDVDGDGLPDMVVGGDYLRVGGDLVGGAWLVSGADIAAQSPEPWVDGAAPTRFVTFGGNQGNVRVEGRTVNGEFGRAVALVPGFEADGRAAVVVGARFDRAAGGTGGAYLYRYSTDPGSSGLNPEPWAIVAGENDRDSWLGREVSGGLLNGEPWLIVGAPRSDALLLDGGAAYAIPLAP